MVHAWPGTYPLAFVFSVPGTQEVSQGKPVAGATGENLSMALTHLAHARPDLFPSKDRYAYRIANAYSLALSLSLGSGRTQARKSEICTPSNATRVTEELKGCRIASLCGDRAQWLEPELRARLPQLRIVLTWHTAHRALASKFSPPEVWDLESSVDRRSKRTELWALHVLDELKRDAPQDGASSSVHPIA